MINYADISSVLGSVHSIADGRAYLACSSAPPPPDVSLRLQTLLFTAYEQFQFNLSLHNVFVAEFPDVGPCFIYRVEDSFVVGVYLRDSEYVSLRVSCWYCMKITQLPSGSFSCVMFDHAAESPVVSGPLAFALASLLEAPGAQPAFHGVTFQNFFSGAPVSGFSDLCRCLGGLFFQVLLRSCGRGGVASDEIIILETPWQLDMLRSLLSVSDFASVHAVDSSGVSVRVVSCVPIALDLLAFVSILRKCVVCVFSSIRKYYNDRGKDFSSEGSAWLYGKILDLALFSILNSLTAFVSTSGIGVLCCRRLMSKDSFVECMQRSGRFGSVLLLDADLESSLPLSALGLSGVDVLVRDVNISGFLATMGLWFWDNVPEWS